MFLGGRLGGPGVCVVCVCVVCVCVCVCVSFSLSVHVCGVPVCCLPMAHPGNMSIMAEADLQVTKIVG